MNLRILSPKRRLRNMVDDVIEWLLKKYDLKLHGKMWIANGEIKFEIDPEVLERKEGEK